MRLVPVGLAVVLAGLAIAAPATASSSPPAPPEDKPYVGVHDLGAGSCTPDVVVQGQPVDCRFPIEGDARLLDPAGGPYVARLDIPFEPDQGELPACRVDGDDLVCHLIPSPATRSTARTVTVWFGDGKGPSATFRTVHPDSQPAETWLAGGTEPVGWLGRPFRGWVYFHRTMAGLGLWGVVHRVEDGSVVETFPLTTQGEFHFQLTRPGRYRFTTCFGVSPTECAAAPGGWPLQVIDPTLHDLVPDHNRPKADRINLVFVGSGFDDPNVVPDVARELLDFGGPEAVTSAGKTVAPSTLDSVPWLVWGPFSVDPLRSARDRFNFWYLAGEIDDPFALWHDGTDPESLDGLPLPYTEVTTLHLLPIGVSGVRSEANSVSFAGTVGMPAKASIRFGGVYLALGRWGPAYEAPTLLHEFGHALFDLRDEYEERYRATRFGYPNCADDREDAEAWWGDLVGSVDPFLSVYEKTMERYGQWVPDDLREELTVGYFPGGCYGGSKDQAIRPTEDSLMNSGIPVFGSVNRRRVQELLDLWSGTEPLSDPADLTLACGAGVVHPGDRVRCSGSLAAGVTPPVGGLTVVAGSTTARCGFDSSLGRVAVECPELVPGPVDVGAHLQARFGGESVDVGGMVVASTTTAAPTTTTVPSPAASNGGALVVLLAGTALAGGAVVWFAMARRHG